ncbi:MAG: hypothetical protein Q7J54_01835 [Candidatus Woesearchaeota archaeon]|nr:hypothetical protein [Candidatus Woesearchaeota archaeon]
MSKHYHVKRTMGHEKADQLISEGAKFEIMGNFVAATGKYMAAIAVDLTYTDAYEIALSCLKNLKDYCSKNGLQTEKIEDKIVVIAKLGVRKRLFRSSDLALIL